MECRRGAGARLGGGGGGAGVGREGDRRGTVWRLEGGWREAGGRLEGEWREAVCVCFLECWKGGCLLIAKRKRIFVEILIFCMGG